MDLRTHLFNRREVVAIFIDVDASMLETDLALPVPVEAASGKQRSSSGASPSPTAALGGGSDNKGSSKANNVNARRGGEGDEAYAPPSTRLEVVREAVRSFIAQKERSVAHPDRLYFALYAVLVTDVMELLPPTQSGQPVIAAAFKRYLGTGSTNKFNELLSSVKEGTSPMKNGVSVSASAATVSPFSATGTSLFPFQGISTILKGIEDAMTSTTMAAASSSPPLTSDLQMLSPLQSATENVSSGSLMMNNGSFASPADASRNASQATRADHSKSFLCVQGIVLLSRPTAPPVRGASEEKKCAAAPSLGPARSSSSTAWIDVVVLGSLQQPLSPLRVIRQEQQQQQQRSPLAKGGNGGEAAAPASSVLTVDVECTLIDPVAFTSISHRGLAVGPTLTKLTATHAHGTDAFLRRPIFMVELPAAPTQLQQGVSGGEEPALRIREATTPSKVEAGFATQTVSQSPAAHAHAKGTLLPPLQAEKPQKRSTPHLASPLQGRAAGASDGTGNSVLAGHPTTVSGTAAVTGSTTPNHFVRGTVVGNSIANGASAPPPAVQSATAAQAAPQSTENATAPGAGRSPGAQATLPTHSPNNAALIFGKRQGLQLRSAVRTDATVSPAASRQFGKNSAGNTNNSSGASASTDNNASKLDAIRSDSVASAAALDGCAALQSVQSSVYPSELIRREESGPFSSTTATERTLRDARSRAESTGSAIKRRQQEVQTQREQCQRRQGSSLGSTPSPSVPPPTTSMTTATTRVESDTAATNRKLGARNEAI